MSKRKWIDVDLAGINFEYNRVDKVTMYIPYVDVYSAYEKPSVQKQNIWAFWNNWFVQHDGACGISSYNCMQFTIDGYFWYDGYKYYAYITKAHNRIWLAPDTEQKN